MRYSCHMGSYRVGQHTKLLAPYCNFHNCHLTPLPHQRDNILASMAHQYMMNQWVCGHGHTKHTYSNSANHAHTATHSETRTRGGSGSIALAELREPNNAILSETRSIGFGASATKRFCTTTAKGYYLDKGASTGVSDWGVAEETVVDVVADAVLHIIKMSIPWNCCHHPDIRTICWWMLL